MAEPLKLFKVLNEHEVEYLVVDKLAAALDGIPVLATSMAIWPLDDPANNVKIAAALREMNARVRLEDRVESSSIDAELLETQRRDLGIGHGVAFVTDIGNVDVVYVPVGIGQTS